MEQRVARVEAETNTIVEEVAVLAELLQLVRVRTANLGVPGSQASAAVPPPSSEGGPHSSSQSNQRQATEGAATPPASPAEGATASPTSAMVGDDHWFAVCMIAAELLSSAHFSVSGIILSSIVLLAHIASEYTAIAMVHRHSLVAVAAHSD